MRFRVVAEGYGAESDYNSMNSFEFVQAKHPSVCCDKTSSTYSLKRHRSLVVLIQKVLILLHALFVCAIFHEQHLMLNHQFDVLLLDCGTRESSR